MAIVVALALSCGGSSQQHAGDSPAARRLTGAWTLRLRLQRFRFEAVSTRVPPRDVIGEMALVPNHWLDGGDALARPTHLGTYDLNFAALGFEPRARGEQPAAVARLSAADSVEIVFEPGNEQELVRMRGVLLRDSIIGHWELEPARAGGDAAGSVIMTRRQ